MSEKDDPLVDLLALLIKKNQETNKTLEAITRFVVAAGSIIADQEKKITTLTTRVNELEKTKTLKVVTNKKDFFN